MTATPMTSIVDLEARERAAHEVGTSFAMSAGAGTGKTTVLVERLVEHLLNGTSPRQLAAITFTEKAAGELRVRARDAIEARLARASEPEEKARLEGVLQRFGELTLSTIHSFCQRLLELEALDAGWAPDTEIAEGATGNAVESAFDAWRAGFDARHPEVAVRLRESGVQDRGTGEWASASLRSAAGALLDNRDLTPRTGASDKIDWAAALRELQDLADRLGARIQRCRQPATCKLVAATRPLVEALQDIARRADPEQAVREALALDVPRVGNVGRAGDWEPGERVAFVQDMVDLGRFQNDWNRQVGAWMHRVIVQDLVNDFLPNVYDARRRAAQADFADLLFRAAALLTEHPQARRRLADRFEVILIDEVQDTDPIQAEVAMLLTRPSDADGPWNAVPPKPGSLFAVGDPKQSIYRFRRADVETWRELQEVVTQGGERLSLRQNFRSVPGLVAWVNHTFASYPEYEPLVPFRKAGPLDPVVVVHAADKDDTLDGLIRHLVDLREHKAAVVDKVSGELRPMRWSDVMILLPTWTRAEAIQDELNRARIDSVVEGGGEFFERDEIKLLLDAMRAIDEPRDSAALVAVLRGLFGISHEELARFRKANGAWSYLVPDPPGGAIADAYRLLRHLHGRRAAVSWVRLLDDLLDQTRGTCVLALTARRWSVLANIDKLKALIYDLEPGCRSPREVITALEHAKAARTEDLSVLDTDLDAVRITSYFKAKGLEAPIVALVHARRKANAIDTVVRRDDRTVAVTPGKEIVPPDWDALVDQEKLESQAERRRWMYVATTRARDQLIICQESPGKSGFGADNLLAEDVIKAMGPFTTAPHDTIHAVAEGVHVRLRQRDALAPVPRITETFPGLDPAVDALLADPPTVGDPDAEARQQAMRQALRSAERASVRWRPVGDLTQRNTRRAEADAGGIGPEGGTVVHAVMEHLDLARPPEELAQEVDGLVRVFALRDGLPDDLASRCAEVVRGLLDHPIIAQARKAPERWREVPFAFPTAHYVVAGKIDLCFPTNAERTDWVVVDWKSHLPPLGSPLRDKYERQIAWYARAVLETVTPCKRVTPYLVGPHPALGLADLLAERLESVTPELQQLVIDASELGAEPLIGWEVELEEDVVAEAELAWPEHRVALTLDFPQATVAAMERFGWRVVNADTSSATWVEQAAEAVWPLLGLETEAEA